MLSYDYMLSQLVRLSNQCKNLRKTAVERVLAAVRFLHKNQVRSAREQMLLAINLLKKAFSWKPATDKNMPQPFRRPAIKQIFNEMVTRLELQSSVT